MNSGKREREKAHHQATKKAGTMACRSCGTLPSEPAHHPTHRGMGGGKAGWEEREWIPLCRHCHDILDRRHGTSPAADFARELVIRQIERGPFDPSEF